MGDVANTELIHRVRLKAEALPGHLFAAAFNDAVSMLEDQLNRLVPIVQACDVAFTTALLKQPPLVIIGNYRRTLRDYNDVLGQWDSKDWDKEEAKLPKILERLVLHNLKIKIMLAWPEFSRRRTFDSHTLEDREDQKLMEKYEEAEAMSKRDNTSMPPVADIGPNARYVEIAFQGALLGVIDTRSPHQDINALVRHLDFLLGGKKDFSTRHKDIAWVRLMTCVRILSRLTSWPDAQPNHPDSDTTRRLRRGHISIQDFILRIEILLFHILQKQQNIFPSLLPDQQSAKSLVQIYSHTLFDQEDDKNLGDEHILRAQVDKPKNTISLGLGRRPDSHLLIKFCKSHDEVLINLREVDLDPAYITGPVSNTIKIVVKHKDSPLELCFREPGDLVTFQNAMTGYKIVYNGEKLNFETSTPSLFPPSGDEHSYNGSLQVWIPNDLSREEVFSNVSEKIVRGVGPGSNHIQGCSYVKPRSPLLILIGEDGKDKKYLIIRISLDGISSYAIGNNRVEIRRDDAKRFDAEETHAHHNKKGVPNLALMGIFQQHRKKERKDRRYNHINISFNESLDAGEFIRLFYKFKSHHMDELSIFAKTVDQSISNGNAQ